MFLLFISGFTYVAPGLATALVFDKLLSECLALWFRILFFKLIDTCIFLDPVLATVIFSKDSWLLLFKDDVKSQYFSSWCAYCYWDVIVSKFFQINSMGMCVTILITHKHTFVKICAYTSLSYTKLFVKNKCIWFL